MSYFDNDNDNYLSDVASDVESNVDENENDNDNDIEEEEQSEEEFDEDEEMDGGDPDEAEEGEEGELENKVEKNIMTTNKQPGEDDDDDDDDLSGEQYLQKFNKDINDNYLMNFHPECKLHNYSEVISMTKIVRDANNVIIDPLHKTIPILTKYERARILGQRAKQINSGATAFIKVPESVIDGYVIAELELQQKRIPFIIRRPLPNGGSEYWNLKDLEDISF